MSKPFLFVALDGLVERPDETLQAARQLSESGGEFGFKINLDYVLQVGADPAVRIIKRLGRPIFTDLKMWNGTRTMASVIEQLVALGVDYLNVYALADNLLPKAVKLTAGTSTKVLGLTVLTHFNEAYCQRHFRRSLPETVRHFAEVSIDAGCHGLILPGTTLGVVSDLETIKLVPGVRPSWYQDTRHEEEITPKAAKEKGADILVCGSPIMKAEDPAQALLSILSEFE